MRTVEPEHFLGASGGFVQGLCVLAGDGLVAAGVHEQDGSRCQPRDVRNGIRGHRADSAAPDRERGGPDPRLLSAEGDAEDRAQAEARVADARVIHLRELCHCLEGSPEVDHRLPDEADPKLGVEWAEPRPRLEDGQDSLAELGACPLSVQREVDRRHCRPTAHPGQAGHVHVVRVLGAAAPVLSENQREGARPLRWKEQPAGNPVTPARELEVQLANAGGPSGGLRSAHEQGDRLVRVGLEHGYGTHEHRV